MGHAWQYAGSPINWCNDDLMDLGDQYTVTDILGAMEQLGLSGTELGRKYPRESARLGSLLKTYHLQLASGWAQIHLADRAGWKAELDAYRRHVELLQKLGSSVVVTAEGSGSVHWDSTGDRVTKVPWSDAEWRNVSEGLEQAGDICHHYGLTLAYHPHLGTNIETTADIQHLLQTTDPRRVSLVLDTGHLAVAQVDTVGLIRSAPDRIAHVHLKSVRPEVVAKYQAGLGFLESVRAGIFTVPGDGIVDFGPIFQALREVEYRGWCVIEAEQDPAVAEPVANMQRALAYLDRL